MTEKARFTHTCKLQSVLFLFPQLFIVWFCHFYPVSVLSTGILNLFYSSSFLKLFWLVKLPHNTVSQKTGHRLEYVFTTWKHVLAFWYKDQLRLKKLTLQLQCQLIHRDTLLHAKSLKKTLLYWQILKPKYTSNCAESTWAWQTTFYILWMLSE